MPNHSGDCMEFSQVVNSRYRGDGFTWRRRVCQKCGRRWTTFEISEAEFNRFARLDKFEQRLQRFAEDLRSQGSDADRTHAAGDYR